MKCSSFTQLKTNLKDFLRSLTISNQTELKKMKLKLLYILPTRLSASDLHQLQRTNGHVTCDVSRNMKIAERPNNCTIRIFVI